MKTRKKWLAVVAVMALLAGSWPAWADIDQLCLKQCVSGGGTASGCLAGCTYGAAETPVGSAAPVLKHGKTGANHNVLSTPLPVSPGTVMPAKKPGQTPAKDYACLTQCLHNGDVYRLCEKRCAKTQCAQGALDCSDVARIMNGAVINAPRPGAP